MDPNRMVNLWCDIFPSVLAEMKTMVEEKWESFHDKAAVVGGTAADASRDVAVATRLLGGELKMGYARIREAIAAAS